MGIEILLALIGGYLLTSWVVAMFLIKRNAPDRLIDRALSFFATGKETGQESVFAFVMFFVSILGGAASLITAGKLADIYRTSPNSILYAALAGATLHVLGWVGFYTLPPLWRRVKGYFQARAEQRRLKQELANRSSSRILARFDEAVRRIPFSSESLANLNKATTALRLLLEQILAQLDISQDEGADTVATKLREANALFPGADVTEILGDYPARLQADATRPKEVRHKLEAAVEAIMFVVMTLPEAIASAGASGELNKLESLRETLDAVFSSIRPTAAQGTALELFETGKVQQAISDALRTTPKPEAQGTEIPAEANRLARKHEQS